MSKLEKLELSPTPVEEECQQVGSDNYAANARKECGVYKQMLERVFPIPEELEDSLYYRITSNPHDFGNYYEVAIMFDDTNDAAIEYAYNVEANLPGLWDEEALKDLKKLGLIENRS